MGWKGTKPPVSAKAGCLGHVPSGFEYLQGLRIHFSGQPSLILCHTHSKIKFFLMFAKSQSAKSSTWGGITPCTSTCWEQAVWKAAFEASCEAAGWDGGSRDCVSAGNGSWHGAAPQSPDPSVTLPPQVGQRRGANLFTCNASATHYNTPVCVTSVPDRSSRSREGARQVPSLG